MFPIINKQVLAQNVKRLDIKAEHIAARVQPGQFVMVVPQRYGEWIPMSVVESDDRRKAITLIFNEVGPMTRRLGSMQINDKIFSVFGPLGQPASIEKFGNIICVGAGMGVAQILPIAKAFKKAGNRVTGVIGAPNKDSLILETQMRLACHNLFISTEDGSYEHRGMAAHTVKELLDRESADLVYVIGPLTMMQEICLMTLSQPIKTYIHVNPVMFCGSGICGSCRVRVGDQMVLACERGTEFDGHQVDFDDLQLRMQSLRMTSSTGYGVDRFDSDSDFDSFWKDKDSLSKLFSGFIKKVSSSS